MSTPSASTVRSATKAVLEGVPKIGYIQIDDGSWELAPFASSIRSALQYLGETTTYNDVMALSGGAFRMVWNNTEWDPGNSDVAHMNGNPLEPFRRVFDAVGYEASFYGRKENEGTQSFNHFSQYLDFEGMRQAILNSIDHSVPVIAIGVIGPPECCVITGYDVGGDVLIGWNFWQGDPGFDAQPQSEECGYFRKADWYAKCDGLVVIGAKKQTLPQAKLDRKTLEWALEVMNFGQIGSHAHGLLGYTAWANDMLNAANFPEENDDALNWKMIVVDDAGMILAARGVAAKYLQKVAERSPAIATDLNAAADLFIEEEKIAMKVWDTMGKYEPRHKSLADGKVRELLASIILEARELDAKAIKHLESAVNK